ncbi:MAG TPA: hypothetical protein VHF01_04660 [Candidatus Acidoferrum sp.]|nr:hypothetical protein [Candidatus Acidoferrum sp.]
MDWILAHLAAVHLDLVTGVALITLLLMMWQTEHERCDRVRAGWREVRRLTFAATTTIQRAKKMQDHADAGDYLERAQTSVNELYSTILLYGKGSLREEYRKQFNGVAKTGALTPLLPIFQTLDGKTERKFDTWKLRIV